MCSRVVLPALSRPKKRSLACLFRRPREARTSQTGGRRGRISTKTSTYLCIDMKAGIRQVTGVAEILTPVDDPHGCRTDTVGLVEAWLILPYHQVQCRSNMLGLVDGGFKPANAR